MYYVYDLQQKALSLLRILLFYQLQVYWLLGKENNHPLLIKTGGGYYLSEYNTDG